MATNQYDYDAIIVGARCAGSPTAMLLARKGYKVLVVDKATFPDTISTHLIHPPGVAALQRWGCSIGSWRRDAPIDACVRLRTVHNYWDTGTAEARVAYAPRRTVLDKLLVDAASEAGAEVREGFTVEQLVIEDGRVTGVRGQARAVAPSPSAPVVIGADGRYSLVAGPCAPSSTTRSRSCWRPTTPTTAACR